MIEKHLLLRVRFNSAIQQIESTGIGAVVDHIEGEYATLSELAKITGFTKQAISLFVKGKRREGNFPVPAFGLNYQSPVWRVYDVCKWFVSNNEAEYKSLLEQYKAIHDMNDQLKTRTFKNNSPEKSLISQRIMPSKLTSTA